MPANNGNGEYARVKNGFLEIRRKLGPGEPSQSGKSTVLLKTPGGKEDVDGHVMNLMLYTMRK